MRIVVSDTSPIRALAHLNLLDFLPELFGEVIVPEAVAAELERSSSKFDSLFLATRDGFQIRRATDSRLVGELLSSLDRGESEAIALAIELKADRVLIDEVAGRAAAIQRGLIVTGALGILIEARRRGRIESIRSAIESLKAGLGFHISDELRDQVLRGVGEA